MSIHNLCFVSTKVYISRTCFPMYSCFQSYAVYYYFEVHFNIITFQVKPFICDSSALRTKSSTGVIPPYYGWIRETMQWSTFN